MTRISVCLLIACCLLAACVNNASRYAMDPGEGEFVYTYETTKGQRDAYYLAEEWLCTNVTDANIITLRQPDTGKLIAHRLLPVTVGMASFKCGYIMLISCKDSLVTVKYILGAFDNGAYAPKAAMPGIEARFLEASLALRDHILLN